MSVFFPFIFIIFVASPAASFTEEWFSSDLKAFEIFSFNELLSDCLGEDYMQLFAFVLARATKDCIFNSSLGQFNDSFDVLQEMSITSLIENSFQERQNMLTDDKEADVDREKETEKTQDDIKLTVDEDDDNLNNDFEDLDGDIGGKEKEDEEKEEEREEREEKEIRGEERRQVEENLENDEEEKKYLRIKNARRDRDYQDEENRQDDDRDHFDDFRRQDDEDCRNDNDDCKDRGDDRRNRNSNKREFFNDPDVSMEKPRSRPKSRGGFSEKRNERSRVGRTGREKKGKGKRRDTKIRRNERFLVDLHKNRYQDDFFSHNDYDYYDEDSYERKKRGAFRPDLTSISDLITREIALQEKFKIFTCIIKRRAEILNLDEVKSLLGSTFQLDEKLRDEFDQSLLDCKDKVDCLEGMYRASSIFPIDLRRILELHKCEQKQLRLLCIKNDLRKFMPGGVLGFNGTLSSIFDKLLDKLFDILSFDGEPQNYGLI